LRSQQTAGLDMTTIDAIFADQVLAQPY